MGTLSLSFPDDLREKLQNKADKDGRSLSNYICRVLKRHLVVIETKRKVKK